MSELDQSTAPKLALCSGPETEQLVQRLEAQSEEKTLSVEARRLSKWLATSFLIDPFDDGLVLVIGEICFSTNLDAITAWVKSQLRQARSISRSEPQAEKLRLASEFRRHLDKQQGQ